MFLVLTFISTVSVLNTDPLICISVASLLDYWYSQLSISSSSVYLHILYASSPCVIGPWSRDGCLCYYLYFCSTTVSSSPLSITPILNQYHCTHSIHSLLPDPIFPLTFLVNSWIPGLFDAIFQASFLGALLLFWLCLYHGVRQVMLPLQSLHCSQIFWTILPYDGMVSWLFPFRTSAVSPPSTCLKFSLWGWFGWLPSHYRVGKNSMKSGILPTTIDLTLGTSWSVTVQTLHNLVLKVHSNYNSHEFNFCVFFFAGFQNILLHLWWHVCAVSCVFADKGLCRAAVHALFRWVLSKHFSYFLSAGCILVH